MSQRNWPREMWCLCGSVKIEFFFFILLLRNGYWDMCKTLYFIKQKSKKNLFYDGIFILVLAFLRCCETFSLSLTVYFSFVLTCFSVFFFLLIFSEFIKIIDIFYKILLLHEKQLWFLQSNAYLFFTFVCFVMFLVKNKLVSFILQLIYYFALNYNFSLSRTEQRKTEKWNENVQ